MSLSSCNKRMVPRNSSITLPSFSIWYPLEQSFFMISALVGMPDEASIGDWFSWDEGPSKLPVSSRSIELSVSFMLSEVDRSLVAIGEKWIRIDSDIDVFPVFSIVFDFVGVGSFPLLPSKENDQVPWLAASVVSDQQIRGWLSGA